MLRSSYVVVMSSWDMAGISITISERLLANQRELYAYAVHVSSLHDSDISISRWLMVVFMLASLALKLLMYMLAIASQVRTGFSWTNSAFAYRHPSAR